MYARRVGSRELTFDFAAGLLEDNLLLVDRETDSVWSQMDGRAVSGPLEGEPLEVVPSIQTTWGHWRSLHPDTRVMVLADEEGHPYIYRAWIPGSPRPENPPSEHDTTHLGLALVVDGDALFLPLRELDRVPIGKLPLAVEVGGTRLLIHYVGAALTAWALDSRGNLAPGVLAYEWGWRRFFPETRIFTAESEL